MASNTSTSVRIEPITTADDFARFFDISALTFGHQIHDGIWSVFNPGWDTPAGREAGILRLVERWGSITKDRNGDVNTVFLKAVVPRDDDSEEEDIAGVAIWVQASNVPGHGDRPATDLGKAMDLEALYPGNPIEQRYLRQLDASLHGRRVQLVSEIASTDSPAVMVLDLCTVDPAFQRRGIAKKLVQWGLDEARRRGGLEAATEASAMGRHVYGQLGFVQEGGEMEARVDEEFRGRSWPSNVFMRTGRA
jgi:GNAT superfamily N-acetyltransferase